LSDVGKTGPLYAGRNWTGVQSASYAGADEANSLEVAMSNSPYRRAWAVVKIFTAAPGFGPGQFVFLGQDNFRPDESQIDFERRVCERFDVRRDRLRYVEIDL
jgi:hypothetical protein